MNFELIDMEHWDRAECYQHFTTVAKSTYSITVDLDITELFRYVREKNVRFFLHSMDQVFLIYRDK